MESFICAVFSSKPATSVWSQYLLLIFWNTKEISSSVKLLFSFGEKPWSLISIIFLRTHQSCLFNFCISNYYLRGGTIYNCFNNTILWLLQRKPWLNNVILVFIVLSKVKETKKKEGGMKEGKKQSREGKNKQTKRKSQWKEEKGGKNEEL